ncbi:unnamed protein product [Brachionus calyciflorus]|uniref:Glycosylphosphatidylinositol anchor attachment 1 n=1 Tax=Brachionus calyciflorus TaxID=104777 RepID=A0A813MN62_9BILA|nr:unnamed protein product [Brachionus calyciflorus]
MSLLNGDSDKKLKLYEPLEKFGPLLSLVGFIAGVVYFCLLPHQLLVHGTYISENALLPGLVSSDIFSTDAIFNFYDYLKNNYETNGGKNYNADLIHHIFSNQLKIESYTQSFNLSYPFYASQDENMVKTGKNVYGFGRAQRADGTESIVVSAPLFLTGKKNKQTPNLFGVAQLFILADLAKNRPYWAKDLIFVVTDMGQIGMQAWINSYFETESEFIKGENLKTRGGSIQAALNLEFKDINNINKLEMKLEGANGKLPNLDLFNTIIRICKSLQFQCSLESEISENNEYHYYYNKAPVQHIPGILNTINMMFKQSTGVPNSLNGYFINHRIEALTISGSRIASEKNSKRSHQKQNVLSTIRIIESTLRSVNNLLERFHQSFFFYLLSSSHHYISIGMYMPSFGLLILPVLIKVLTLWFSIFLKKDSNDEKSTELSSSIMLNLFKSIIPKFLVSGVFGIVLYFGTSYFLMFGKKMNLSAKDALINSYIAVMVNILGMPIILKTLSTRKEHRNETSEKLKKLLVLLSLTIFVGTVSLLNFSLSFFIAIFYSPISLLAVQDFSNKFLRLLQQIALVLSCPLIYFSFLYLAYLNFYENFNILRNYDQMFQLLSEKFYDFVLLSKISSIWTYDMINLFLVPIWSALWLISFN